MIDRDLYMDAWIRILGAAESILEDALNEDGEDENYYARVTAAIWAILDDPGAYTWVLNDAEVPHD